MDVLLAGSKLRRLCLCEAAPPPPLHPSIRFPWAGACILAIGLHKSLSTVIDLNVTFVL